MNWYLAVLKNYAGFSGRARRTEYWMFALISFIITAVLDLIGLAVRAGAYLGLVYALLVLIPSIAVAVRRLHDTGRSGWWLLLTLIPLVGGIIVFVFMVLDSQPGDNQYGPNPKQAAAPVA